MKTLDDYILGVSKDYSFRIRFLFEITEEMVESIETYLQKYEVINISSPEKTMFLKNALGWAGPVNSEVWIVDVTVAMPVSTFQLSHDLATFFKVPVEKISVSTDQEEDINYITQHSGAILDDPYYENAPKMDHSDYYGDEYNKKMIDTIENAKENVLNRIFGQE